MTKLFPGLPAWLLAGVAWLCLAGPALAGDIYVYRAADGSRLITDHPRVQAGYRLVKVYSESDVWNQTGGSNRKPRERAFRPRPSAYDDLIASAARRASLDPLLVKSVMQAESAFNPKAVSHKGASGLMQLMPGTARRYGVSRIFDPRENVLGGARYLSDLLEQFDGRLDLALAGYNAGENAVIERGGIPPYAETQRYVRKVLRLYKKYRNEKCQNHRDKLESVNARIISCSASSPPAELSNMAASSAGTVDTSAANTVSSADERQWRPIE